MLEFLKSDKFILPIVYIVIGVIIHSVISFVIKKISRNKYVDKKKKTIISLVKNILRYFVYKNKKHQYIWSNSVFCKHYNIKDKNEFIGKKEAKFLSKS